MNNMLLNSDTSKKFFDKGLGITSLLSFLIAGLVFGYFMVINGGVSSIYADYNLQSVPFAMHINDYLKNWQGEWDWSLDLGASFLTGYSYYNLFSPFMLLTLVFPASWIPYVMSPMYVLKFVVAAGLAYTYIKMFVNNHNYAIVGGLLYAFSGFQLTNLVFQFHDSTALFPLMLIALERLVKDKNPKLFIFSVFLACITNYFVFVSEVIFLILYFVFRCWCFERKEFFRLSLKCLLCGLLGVGLAGFVFIPNIYYILHSERTETGGVFYIDNLFYSVKDALAIFKGYFFPAEAMNGYSTFFEEKWDSLSCYLPLVGFSLTTAFYLKSRKSWIGKLTIFLIIIGFSPIASSLFYCGSIIYHRWQFMPILLFALITSYILDNFEDYPVKKATALNLVIVVVFTILLLILPSDPFSENHYNIVDAEGFIYQVIVSVFSLLLLLFLILLRTEKQKSRLFDVLLIVFVSVSAVITLFSVYDAYNLKDKETLDLYKANLNMSKFVEQTDEQYRFLLFADNTPVSASSNLSGIVSFSSTVSSSTYELYRNFGFSQEEIINRTLEPEAHNGLLQLLGGKYQIAKNGNDFEIIESDACPIGFAYDTFVLEDEFVEAVWSGTDPRTVVALDSLVIDKKDKDKVATVLSQSNLLESTKSIDLSSETVSSLVERNASNAVSDFCKTKFGFVCECCCDTDKAIFFSVPYDEGWSAKVNGTDSEIMKANGMMYILVPSGENQIEFSYQTPCKYIGLLSPLISLAFICGYKILTKFD